MTTYTEHEMAHLNYTHSQPMKPRCHYCKVEIKAGKFCAKHAEAHRNMIQTNRCSNLDIRLMAEHDRATS